MKHFLTYGFISLYLLAMIRPIAPVLEYVIFQDYISEFLCINRDNNTLECKGKCYLMTQLQKQNKENTHQLPKISMDEYPIGFVSIAAISIDAKIIASKHFPSIYDNQYSFLFNKMSFRPPNTIVG